MTSVRLNKYLAECGIASRRKADELIEEGRVRVNSRVVSELGTKVTPGVDRVTVGKRKLSLAPKGIILLNKPRGVVSTLADPGGRPTVADYLGKHEQSYFPVGRLDYDSTGLMVLTNDGELAQRLSHPSWESKRVYRVRVAGHPSRKTLQQLSRGVRLRDGLVQADTKVMRDDEKSTWLEVTVAVGKNRIIRRLLEHVRHPVLKLQRVVHGPFALGRLPIGKTRKLSQREYVKLRGRLLS